MILNVDAWPEPCWDGDMDVKRLPDGDEDESYNDRSVPGNTKAMKNQQLMDNGHQMMDETDQAIERFKKVVHETVNVGTETAAALKA
ncbi:hypothetical protein Tco_0090910 [Tanacetum coccineum]